ncbi:hypothetical protein JR782_004923 [Salmonella enterica subsp. enterica serovar Eastbourne]|nr:hypothetical protein [Salmonella enterica subsp. enterica serovar Eastbourne]EHC5910467.1 hypothetical protein [Salmonella enterica subsp. enterica serovar Eastbourne]EJW4861888.1 hypothetical protein [Salmonella enterica]
MRLTSRKKKILSYFEPDYQEWVTSEIGAPPLDVSGVAYLIYGSGISDNRHWIESTRVTGKKALLMVSVCGCMSNRDNRSQ